ncbi:MAG: PilN domain-containing protein [Burkholderiaceae bacterium]|nr:PilN domain-containing protein [Burkholderiaceae bacterium]
MSQQINLISPLLLKKRYAFGVREMGAVMGLVLVCALAWAGYLHYQASVLEAEAELTEAQQAEAQQALDELTVAASRPVSALLTERVKATQAQVAQREALLASVGHTIEQTSTGFSPRLRALAHGGTEGVWLNGFTLSPGYVALKGAALNASLLATYIDRLGKQPPFEGMRFSGMNAALGASQGGPASQAAALPDHLDFDLYSGSPTGKGGSHGE